MFSDKGKGESRKADSIVSASPYASVKTIKFVRFFSTWYHLNAPKSKERTRCPRAVTFVAELSLWNRLSFLASNSPVAIMRVWRMLLFDSSDSSIRDSD